MTSKEEVVCLSFDQKGKFSPIAKEDNISGVHSIRNLLTKRLPLMVRLVHGKPPPGLKSFQSYMRLYNLFEEDYVLAMPLLKDTQTVVSVPSKAALKLTAPKNGDVLSKLHEFAQLAELLRKTVQDAPDKAQAVEMQVMGRDAKSDAKDEKLLSKLQRLQYDHKGRFHSNYLVKRSMSDPQTYQPHVVDASSDHLPSEPRRAADVANVSGSLAKQKSPISDPELSDKCYDEIDQIYDYVRGFAPLPLRIANELTDKKSSEKSKTNSENKPNPPPIETIPTLQNNRRVSYPEVINDIPFLKAKKKSRPNQEHIYERISPKGDENAFRFPSVRIPLRSNSWGKVHQPLSAKDRNRTVHPSAALGAKLFVKSSSGQKNTSKSQRILRYAKHVSPFRTEQTRASPQSKFKDLMHYTCRSSRSLTTSPIFHIRYKSLNNLYFTPLPLEIHSNRLESSNSGETSSGSNGSKEIFKDPRPKFPKFSRSLTNLFWDINIPKASNIDKVNNELNSRKNSQILIPYNPDLLSAKNERFQAQQTIKEHNCKLRLATLYL